MSGGGLLAGGGVIGVIVYVISLFLGGDAGQLQELQNPGSRSAPVDQHLDDERAAFVKVVLAETEDVWNKIFREQGMQYQEPTLVLFRDAVQSGCGNASSAMGPFYCPADGSVYIDLAFYQDLQDRFKAPGDFAMAYVVGHEVGHHVQNLLGISGKVDRLRGQVSETEFNKYSVMLELQADFFAGVWAHHTQAMDTILEAGDIEEALNAANAIGDDRLQRQSQGHVTPDAFTHGTSAQRMYWFRKGWETGDIRQGDTFSSAELNQ
jgi:predicted metalloprotease